MNPDPVGSAGPERDRHPGPADLDLEPYPFQPNAKLNYSFPVNFHIVSKILKFMTPRTMTKIIKTMLSGTAEKSKKKSELTTYIKPVLRIRDVYPGS